MITSFLLLTACGIVGKEQVVDLTVSRSSEPVETRVGRTLVVRVGTLEDNNLPNSIVWTWESETTGNASSDVLDFVDTPGQTGEDYIFDVVAEGEEYVTLYARNAGQGVATWSEAFGLIAE